METRVLFAAAGLKLEGMLSSGGRFGAVLCHPHPMYGGSMDNNVVHAAAGALQRSGWTTLRFNFRGVGRSQGSTGDGTQEVEDVTAAIMFLNGQEGIPPERTVLVGYSYGAWVGLRALERNQAILGWVAIAPPLGIWDFSFAKGLGGRKLILAGDEDEFCPVPELRRFVDTLPDPKESSILAGADHFFWGQEAAISRALEVVTKEWAVV